jgi:hypothetical protein
MLRLLTTLAAATLLACAADNPPIKELSREAFKRTQETLICAIPLREVRAGIGRHIDPIAKPVRPVNLDKIAHPAPIQGCPAR